METTPRTESLRPQDCILSGGVKYDAGKIRWSLAPWIAFRGILKVIEYGARKYAVHNWEQGMDWSRPFDACIRHLSKWWEGEDLDPESGLSHLYHAGCNICFLIVYFRRGIGKDDRPVNDKETQAQM